MSQSLDTALKSLESQGVPYTSLTALQVFPCWSDSDPRLSSFPEDFQAFTLPEVLRCLRNTDTLPMVWKRMRLFCSVFLDGLMVWKDYERFKDAVAQDVDLSDPIEQAKVDLEFRRYLNRKSPEQIYEEDFEEYEDFKASAFFNSTFDRENSEEEGKKSESSVDSTLSRGSEISMEVEEARGSQGEEGCESTLYEADSIDDPSELSPLSSQCEIHDYQIIKFLGKGGEGKVYLAYSPFRHKHVALKQYEVEISEGSELERILRKEVDIMRRLEHRNVVKCYGLYNPPSTFDNVALCSLILEYIPGGSLADILKHNGAFSPLELKRITKDVLQGLNYIHRHGLIHRDIKPSNVLIGDCYKITDFGLSAVVLELESIARSSVGTPWYMAPEVILQEPYSFSADIWSLACMVLELSTGQRPFHSASATKALRLMVDCESPLDHCEHALAPDLKDFLEKCWRKQHSLRPSAAELLSHPYLRNAL